MSYSLDLDQILTNLIKALGPKVYFILISSENGVVKKAYINESEFNKSSIALNVSQLYEIAEEIANDIGLQAPDFNIIHTANYYILSIKLLENIIVLLTEDQIVVKDIFDIINKSIKPK